MKFNNGNRGYSPIYSLTVTFRTERLKVTAFLHQDRDYMHWLYNRCRHTGMVLADEPGRAAAPNILSSPSAST